MVTTTIEKPAATGTFPATAVEEKLRSALLATVKSITAMQDVALPEAPAAQYAVAVHLDSLGVVELLCEIDPIVGFELKDSVVRSGGYRSVNEAVGHLMPRIEAAWNRNASKGGKK